MNEKEAVKRLQIIDLIVTCMCFCRVLSNNRQDYPTFLGSGIQYNPNVSNNPKPLKVGLMSHIMRKHPAKKLSEPSSIYS